MKKPRFHPMTLEIAFYNAVCDCVNQDFADSYLTGAELSGRRLTPRTLTAYHKMRDVKAFRDLLGKTGIELVEPTPWPGLDGNRLSHRQISEAYH